MTSPPSGPSRPSRPSARPPYRDEVESLRAENERLRVALNVARARRRIRVGVTAGLIALELGAIFVLQPWLNATSDLSFLSAVTILVVLGVAAALSAFGFRGKAGDG